MKVTISTVTPVYSGAPYIETLVEELATLRNHWLQSEAPVALTESIFVDDSSVDDSFRILNELAKKHDWVRVICLSRNYGQHSATVAGICHSSTDWVVTLDEDLQHKPELITELFRAQLRDCADIVYAKGKQAPHGNNWRDKASRSIKRLLAKLTSTPQITIFNSFRLIRGSIARAAASSSSSHTYFDIALSWFTKSCSSVEVAIEDSRYINDKKSGYGFLKLINHARRLIVSSQLDIATSGLIVGIIAVMTSIIIAVSVVVQKLFFPELIASVGWASIISVVSFFGGVLVAILCIALEYLGVLVANQLGKPVFFTVDRSKDEQLKHWFND